MKRASQLILGCCLCTGRSRLGVCGNGTGSFVPVDLHNRIDCRNVCNLVRGASSLRWHQADWYGTIVCSPTPVPTNFWTPAQTRLAVVNRLLIVGKNCFRLHRINSDSIPMGFILCCVYDIICAGEIYTHTNLNFTNI